MIDSIYRFCLKSREQQNLFSKIYIRVVMENIKEDTCVSIYIVVIDAQTSEKSV